MSEAENKAKQFTDEWIAAQTDMQATQSVVLPITSGEPAAKNGDNPLSTRRWEDYGFHTSTLKTYKIKDISASEATELGFGNVHDGIYITYPRDSDSRIRWHLTGFAAVASAGKYGQKPNTLPAMYYPPTMGKLWMNNTSIPVVVTEGEFKAIAVDLLVNGDSPPIVAPISVGGVFSWQSSKTGIDLINDFKEVSWVGRLVYLAFDMDQTTNAMVSLALSRLTNKLCELGAFVMVVQWPAESGKGIDDYLTTQMLPRDAWLNMVSQAQFSTHIATVLELNTRFTYCEVQQQVYDSQNMTYIAPKSFSSDFFTQRLKVQTGVKGGVAVLKDMPLGMYWLQSPSRTTVVEPVFMPGKPRLINMEGRRYLNTWMGWGQGLRAKGLEPVKGDVSLFYKFLEATFGGESQEHVKYLVKRLAWIFQQPLKKHPTWLYFLGKPLQGKSTLINIISELVGTRYTANVDEDIVRGQFAEWRSDKMLVTFDDSSIKDPRVIRQLLKRLTTEANSQVNLKYVKAQTTESYFTFMFATNSVDALLDHDDRRALVLEAECGWDFEKGEWAAFDAWRATRDGMQALLHHFMYEVKIEAAFYNEVPPKTHARELVIEVGESNWDDLINYFAMSKAHVQWPKPASGETRYWKPTIFSVDMLRAVFLLRNGDSERFKAASATLVGKLVRYGARRCTAEETSDTRGRLMLDKEQVTLWTWDLLWMHRSRGDYLVEYRHLQKTLPELFPGTVKAKF